MTEYITKEQAVQAVNDAVDAKDEAIEAIAAHIDAIPAADIAPVVHARWIEDDCAFMRCSLCGYENDWEWATPYCPHCGARMDSEESE